MRGDLAAAMLHSPSILFLDEPTIGLDVEAKYAIRQFILEINKSRKVTVILTTHDLDDVEQLCSRLMVINYGKIIDDGPMVKLINRLAPNRLLVVDLASSCQISDHPAARILKREGDRVWFEFEKNRISAARLISDLSERYPVRDLSVKEPDIEDMIRQLYKSSCPAQ